MVSEGTAASLALAYLVISLLIFFQFILNLILRFHSQADNTSLANRASAFGLFTGVCSAAFVCGTLASRFLATDYIFQVLFFSRPAKSITQISCSAVLCFEIQCIVLWLLDFLFISIKLLLISLR